MARSALLLGAMLTLAATSAAAQTESVSAGPDGAGVVIYRDRPVDTAALLEESQQDWNDLDRRGLALIVERRVVDVPAGEGVIRFRGVATGIVPQSATLDGLPATVVERNTDFDILSPGSLLQKSVGETVRVVRTNPVTGEQVQKAAIVRSGPAGTVLEIDGRLEALSCSGLTERIVFDRMPEGLSDQPVLSVRTRAERAGWHTVTLAYLATGLQWSADYVARLEPDGRTLALEGWLTLANFGGTGFPDAPVQVVAGTLRRDDSTVPIDAPRVVRTPECWPLDTTTRNDLGPSLKGQGFAIMAPPPAMAPSEAAMVDEIIVTGSRIRRALAEQGELGDYKIYTLPEPTTVAARQTKQVRFLDQPDVTYDRVYRHRIEASETEPRAPQLLLRARNDRRNGLGLALPGGSVSLIEASGDRRLFSGQARFDDRAVGLAVELELGAAMGLSVVTRTGEAETIGDMRREAFEVVVNNDKTEAAVVELVPDRWDWRGFRIVRASRDSAIGEAGYPAWTIRVAPGRSERLTFTTEVED